MSTWDWKIRAKALKGWLEQEKLKGNVNPTAEEIRAFIEGWQIGFHDGIKNERAEREGV